MACIVGPQIHELEFFNLIWMFVQEFVEKFSNWSILGQLAEHLFVKMAYNVGPQVFLLAFFMILTPLQF